MLDYDLIVIGSGPGGYVAAIRATQLGLKTAIVESDEVGGVCLNWGCIPSKSLLKNAEVVNIVKDAAKYGIEFDNLKIDYSKAVSRSRNVVSKLTQGVKFLLKKNGVDNIKGHARFVDTTTVQIKESNKSITATNIIIATGAKQKQLLGINIDHKNIITSRDALELNKIPDSIAIIGGGATGVEFAHIYESYGSKVTIIELLDRLLPQEDEEISNILEKSYLSRNINILTKSSVINVVSLENSASIQIIHNNENETIEYDKVLVAIGAEGNTSDLKLESIGIQTENSFITTNEDMSTNIPNVYAIGDVTGKILLAHVASAQGTLAAEKIAGLAVKSLNYDSIPKAVYCQPQIASFGMTEQEALMSNKSIKVGKFPITASGKALAIGESEGIVKLIVDESLGELLGAHLIGPEVTELLSELSITKLLEGTVNELGELIHPHPTISEALKEAALDVNGTAIHILKA